MTRELPSQDTLGDKLERLFEEDEGSDKVEKDVILSPIRDAISIDEDEADCVEKVATSFHTEYTNADKGSKSFYPLSHNSVQLVDVKIAQKQTKVELKQKIQSESDPSLLVRMRMV